MKNYKLKHSRLLTCYSALLYLLAVFSENGAVSPTDAASMIALSPTKRLEWMLSRPGLARAKETLENLIASYERFLANVDASEDELVARFLNKQTKKQYWESAFELGDFVFAAFNVIGEGNRLHRLLVV